MTFSRRTLSLLTVLLLLGGLGAGVWWRLGGAAEGPAEARASEADSMGVEVPSAEAFSADMPQPVGGAPVARDTLWISVSASGQAEARRRATLKAQVTGVVQAVAVRENRRVAAGQPLLQVDTLEYALRAAQAESDLRRAEADFRQMVLFDDDIEDAEVRRQRERIARARSGLDQAEVAHRVALMELARTRVEAPFPGRVADLKVVVGQHVTAGTDLLTVVDLDPIVVEVRVLEAELASIEEGRRASVRFAAFPEERFEGRVESVNPVVDPGSRTGRVTVVLPNPAGRIKPGMYAEVALAATSLPDRVLVPRSAILERGEGRARTMLFVYEEDAQGRGRAKWRYVTTGRANDTLVEIVPSGEGMVEAGETVLVDGHHYLAHDTPVRLVEDVAAEGGRPGA
ncbi:MAG: efflux RND transporter periplasmic adaptor subunit [Gemmatimonadetes bacterium]|nr:efflux RND transporter periplasmic adaptor subunit [Gemmatimonadota bacterium]